MHAHSGGLVDGNDIFVFVKNFERDSFRLCDHHGPRCDLDDNFLSAAQMHGTFLRRAAVHQDLSGVNQLLHTSATESLAMLRDDHIEPPARFVRYYGELMWSACGCEKARREFPIFVICA